MRDRYWLQARDKPGLLVAMMRLLVGDARISFEGDLSQAAGLFDVPGAALEETAILRRHTIHPVQDFVVVGLDGDTLPLLTRELSEPGRLTRDVLHVQIEKAGAFVFGAYDNFHDECTTAGPGVPLEMLEDLKRKGVLRSFQQAG